LNGNKSEGFTPEMRLINIEDMMDTNDSHQLIIAYLAGNQAALERLIQNYQADIYRLALSILGNSADANEASQDAFIAMVNSLDSYQHLATFKTWLYTITVNVCCSRLRKARTLANLNNVLRAAFHIQSQGIPSAEEKVIQKEKDAALWQAIGKLSDKHRIPLVLRYFNDLSVIEIAEIMGIHEGTIHSRLHFAREQLRAELEKEAD
jgi:RNA polymerase sigma-70 factor, ECF subfamily